MEKTLAILTKDVAFGHTLAEYILNSHVLKYRVIPFYDVTDYLQFRDSHDVNVLLADEEFEQDLCITADGRVFFLTEEKKDDENTVFKYQSLEITVKELSFKLYVSGGEDAPKNNRFGIISVASGRGGSGVTTFALTLAGVLGRKQNVLLVSLDPFPHLPPDIEAGDGELGELIYGLNASQYSNLFGCIHHGRDFDHISGVLTFEYLCYFGREEIRNFLAWMSNDGRYKTIVFDMGTFPLCSGVILEKSETIYLVGEENSMAAEQIERLLSGKGGAKIKNVKLPLVKQFQEGTPAYADLENTELWDFVVKLVEDERGTASGTDDRKQQSQNVIARIQNQDVSDVNATEVPKRNFLERIGIR